MKNKKSSSLNLSKKIVKKNHKKNKNCSLKKPLKKNSLEKKVFSKAINYSKSTMKNT